VCYDFKSQKVQVTHYAIRSYEYGHGGSHPRSWVLEGSLDGTKWIEIDRREDDESLREMNRVAEFSVATVERAQFIRLRQTGKNWHGTQCLTISAFEIFGILEE
jgi:E3 ubiquitin-protein ligase HECTD1